MIYALLGVLLAGFGGGFWVSHEWDKAQLWQMENAIRQQKAEAETVLKGIIARVEQQTQEQITANTNLESARNAYLQTAIALHDSQSSTRLRVPVTGTCGSGSVPEADHTEQLPEPETDFAYLPTESANYLRNLALNADRCAINHNALLTFVQSGCGVDDRPN